MASLELADRGGLEAVTMRSVGAAVGLAPAALYRYVASRDALLELAADAGLRDFDLPEPSGDWLEDAVALARAQVELYGRHPGLVELASRGVPVGMRTLDVFEAWLRVLEPAGADSTAAFEAIGVVTGITILFARSVDQERGPAMFASADPRAHPHLTRALAHSSPAPGDLFDRTVRTVLTGLLRTP